ncbi:uncharacterized protein YfaS (alpha-2-macroglobulin family) [Flavobacterium sp. PL11]|uniref:alpha-2-macroglobulin family protein n=1 Tax=Flavobacterium sp. PL11 TaxID=3071717 RepID=UPI002E087EA8|nr:uncharacterized protein YfaS (alpha-2-macroglobulin family) [Flavobacterium sp. PL11]
MKKIVLLLLLASLPLFAQKFDKKWDAVIELEKEGKIKSASELVDKIYNDAVAKRNETEIIRCFFYKSKYIQTLEENAQTKILSNLRSQISSVSEASKAILNFVYGKCLNDYYFQNRYSRNARTSTDSLETNFLLWSNDNLKKQIELAFENSIANEAILKKTSLKSYNSLFETNSLKNVKEENLYEYLVNENIAYFTKNLYYSNIYNTAFTAARDTLYGKATVFQSFNFDFIKDENLKKLLTLYQKKERNNSSLENRFARMQFCHKYLIKDSNYFLNVLQKIDDESSNIFLLQDIQLEKTKLYMELASKDIHPDYNQKAIALLDTILDAKSRSNAYNLAIHNKHKLQQKQLEINLLDKIYNNENTRAYVKYKNVNTLTISYFKIDQKILSKLNDWRIYRKRDSIAATIIENKPLVKTLSCTLLNKNDYFNYSTEILLPQLEIGSYLVYFESESDKNNTKAFAYQTITVTNLSLLKDLKNGITTYQVLDRKTGKPIENANIKFLNSKLKSDKNGMAFSDLDPEIKSYFDISMTKGSDTLVVASINNYYNNTTSIEVKNKAKVEFYLDRAIYRPGQTVFYKGIIFQKIENENSVVPNVLVKIVLKDNNNKEIRSFEATSNSFGSFSGEFQLPKKGLMGTFKIQALKSDKVSNDGSSFWDTVQFYYSETYFKVEEYKRPKFEVVFQPIKESYTIDQNIRAEGMAKSFSGATIANSKVKYRITYATYTTYKNRYASRGGQDGLISNGETKTDDYGKFNIDFIAKADLRTSKDDFPIFSYRITADVTDSNGETHTATQTINVGYHAIAMSIKVPSEINAEDKNVLELGAKNLNDQVVTVDGELKMYFLKGFPNKIKPRTWPIPEIEGISRTNFARLFPLENNEKPVDENEIGTLVYSKKINTAKDRILPLDFIENYKSGYYKVVLSAKDLGSTIPEKQVVVKVNQQSEKFNFNNLLTIEQLNENPRKDGFVQLKIKSIIPDVYFRIMASHANQLFYDENKTIDNSELVLKIQLQKHFINSIKIGLESIFDNQSFTRELEVFLKAEEQSLNFTTESFRNKIQPGSTENWSFKLNALNTDLESEILASMYDSSLDQFAVGQWSSLNLDHAVYNTIPYRKSLLFNKASVSLRNMNTSLYGPFLSDTATKLMWFGFNFSNPNDHATLAKYDKYLSKINKKGHNSELLSGIVSDESGSPLEGVYITIKGTSTTAVSDYEGYYEIKASKSDVLVFSYIGYQTQTLNLDKNKQINVKLKTESGTINEVVVVAFGSDKKTFMAGSVQVMDKKMSAQSIKGDPEAVAAEEPAFDRKSSAINLRDAANSVIVEEDNQIYNTAGVEIVMEGTIVGNMIKYAAINKDITNAIFIIDGITASRNQAILVDYLNILSIEVLTKEKATAIYGKKGENAVVLITTNKSLQALSEIKSRANLSETAFFYPHLKTDKSGKISFSFTSPEALTSWKLRLLAHNKKAVTGGLEKVVFTQKDLMIIPNFPRFLREKDSIQIIAKIVNMTSETKIGIAALQLFDATTVESADIKMLNNSSVKNYSIPAFGNTTVSWNIYIPEGMQGVQYKVLAKSDNYTDGEENIIPVLTSTILVTESIPLWVRGNSKKEYIFENLKNNVSISLRNHQFTLEYTSNPAWLALQSLPYLIEGELEGAEQTFARFYANSLASKIINSNPKIASLFESWRKNGKLNSKLQTNEELKSILLAETPWVNDAQSEADKKSKLALLFDLEKMKSEQEASFDKLKQKQQKSGGFPWYGGTVENEYITRHILAGLGHLMQLNSDNSTKTRINEISKNGIPFIDRKFLENYQESIRNLKNNEKIICIQPYSQLHYLYTRSFYLESHSISDSVKKATKEYIENIKENWLSFTLYEKALATVVLNRFGEQAFAKKIIESLRETSSNNDDWGMYWIANKSGWYWYQAPIETQALLIEAFTEVGNDSQSVDAMKVWLLKNKQAKNWPTTKSTTEAVYALLMEGSDWLSIKDNTIIKIGDNKILTKKLTANEKEAETGYVKMNWKAKEINTEMAAITIDNRSKVPGYGGVYWQYFDDLDKIKSNSDTSLSVSKELYLKKFTDKGTVLQKITTNNALTIGDLVTVRLIINTKEDMEFVHLKDMRASCFEPIDVLSAYQYTDNLGFYKSTKDAATHFFFDKINKGTYVLEYDIQVNNSGNFSNGITTIQSLYAPEFASHTKGIKISVKH